MTEPTYAPATPVGYVSELQRRLAFLDTRDAVRRLRSCLAGIDRFDGDFAKQICALADDVDDALDERLSRS